MESLVEAIKTMFGCVFGEELQKEWNTNGNKLSLMMVTFPTKLTCFGKMLEWYRMDSPIPERIRFPTTVGENGREPHSVIESWSRMDPRKPITRANGYRKKETAPKGNTCLGNEINRKNFFPSNGIVWAKERRICH